MKKVLIDTILGPHVQIGGVVLWQGNMFSEKNPAIYLVFRDSSGFNKLLGLAHLVECHTGDLDEFAFQGQATVYDTMAEYLKDKSDAV